MRSRGKALRHEKLSIKGRGRASNRQHAHTRGDTTRALAYFLNSLCVVVTARAITYNGNRGNVSQLTGTCTLRDRGADLKVLDKVLGALAQRPEVDDAAAALHQQQLVEGLHGTVGTDLKRNSMPIEA